MPSPEKEEEDADCCRRPDCRDRASCPAESEVFAAFPEKEPAAALDKEEGEKSGEAWVKEEDERPAEENARLP